MPTLESFSQVCRLATTTWACCALVCCLTACRPAPPAAPVAPADSTTSAKLDQAMVHKIEVFCGHCHAAPKPESFAKSEWRAEVAQGFRFYESAENLHLEVPPQELVVQYYEGLAPEQVPAPVGVTLEAGNRFQRVEVAGEEQGISLSALVPSPTTRSLWGCDMQTGAIFEAIAPGKVTSKARPLEFSNPCRLSEVDINQDGQQEFLISDLGSFFPEDHAKGGLWRWDPQSGSPPQNILQGVARVCDAQAGDLDQDGDIDLVVAEFGWRRTGRVLILWHEPENADSPWRTEVLDKRHGAIDVPLVDINQDGKLDILVLLSQEFELVLAYLNQGNGTFEPTKLYDPGDPSFGTSGMQVIDFDGDSDLDLVHTNGDSFDSSHAKPFHGVRWLENTGTFPFAVHEMTQMAGVHDVAVADLDSDGDLDVAAVSLLPKAVTAVRSDLPSVVWLERLDGGKFQQHVVEVGMSDHAACAVLDWDSDGDLDLIASNFRWQEERGSVVSWYRNGE